MNRAAIVYSGGPEPLTFDWPDDRTRRCAPAKSRFRDTASATHTYTRLLINISKKTGLKYGQLSMYDSARRLPRDRCFAARLGGRFTRDAARAPKPNSHYLRFHRLWCTRSRPPWHAPHPTCRIHRHTSPSMHRSTTDRSRGHAAALSTRCTTFPCHCQRRRNRWFSLSTRSPACGSIIPANKSHRT